MATAGTLNLVLGADSTQLRQELGKVRQESQSTALAITNLFGGDTINAVGFRLIRGTVTGLIADIDDLNNGLSITDSLVNNLGASFADMGDIALLQLGQVAEFLGDDLFQTPLAGLQSASLENVGLGQLEGAFKIVTAGSNAVKILEAGLNGLSNGFAVLDGVLNTVQVESQAVAGFFLDIARSAELVSDIFKTAASVIDGAIELVLDSLEAVFPAVGMIRDAAKALGLEFSVGKSLLGDYIDQLDRIEGAAQGAAEGALDISRAAGDARQGINQADAAIDEFGGNLKAQRQAAMGFESAMKDLADAAVLFDQWKQISDIVDGALGSFEQNFQAALAAETLSNRLELVSSSAGGAREDLAFLGGITDELGVDFNAAAEGFTQFSTAATLANLSTAETKDIFESLTQATAVMGLSTADTQGTFLALQQVLSSGNLQLEELNQIAERVPGTFQAAAAALGVTTAELKGLVSTGKVDSKTFLVGFAQQLESFTDAGVVDAMDGGTAAVNRFNNALGNFQIAAGQAWLEVGTPALNTFAKALEFAAKNEELFSSAVDAILIAAIPLFIAGISKATIATYQFVAANKTAAVNVFGKQLKFSAAEMGKYARNVGLAYIALEVFYRILDVVQDGGKSTREAIKSLDKSIQDLTGTASNAPDLQNLIPTDPVAANWLDGIVKGLKDAENSGNLFQMAMAQVAQVSGLGIATNLNKMVTFFKTGKYEITTLGEKLANDALVAIGDLGMKIDTILGESINLREQTLLGQGPIKEVERLDAALKALEQRKLGVDPKDEKAVAALLEEEQALLKQRSDAQEKILSQQSATNNALAQARQELQALEGKGLGAPGYELARSQLEVKIKLLEQEKAEFDKVANVAVEQTKNIADAYKDSNKQIESSYSDRQAVIAEALAAGNMTEEQAREANAQAEKTYLEEKLRNNKSTLEKLKTELEKDTQLRAIKPDAAGLLSQEQLGQYKQQVEQLETETAQTRIELAQKVADAKKEALDKELADLEQANAEAESLLQRSQNARIAGIRQQQLAGALSEEEAQQRIGQAQQQGIADQIANERKKLEQIKGLKERGVLSAEEAAEQERGILDEISGLNLERLEAEVQAQKAAEDEKKKAAEETVRAVERANAAAAAAIENSKTDRITAIREQQRAGVLSEKQAQEQIQQIQQDSADRTITQKQDELAEVRQLRADGTLSAEDAADKEIALTKEIADLNLQRIEQEIAAQQELKQARLDAVEAENERAQRKVEDDQTERITAIKAAQRDRVISEEQAAAQIAAIERKGTRQAIALKQDEIESIRQLQAEGLLTVEEAADKEAELTSEIGDLKQQEIEQQIEAQQTASDLAVEAIEKEGELRRQALETASEQLDLTKNALQSELDLLDAKMKLQQSLNTLEEERLNTRIAAAEAAGDEEKADRLRKQIIKEQRENLEESFAAQEQQLALQQRIRSLDVAKEVTTARIAQIEAEIALRKAVAEGATQQEIAGLQQILSLRQSQVGAAVDAAGAQREINQIERQNLEVEQGIALEDQRQTEIGAGLRPGRGSEGISTTAPSFSGGVSLGSFSTAAAIPAFDSGVGQAFNASTSSGMTAQALLQGAVPADSPLRNSGGVAAAAASTDASSISQIVSTGSQQVVERLDKLEIAILQLANSPRSLSVSTPDPMKDMGDLMSTLSSQQLKGAKL